ncbi:MAG TPA: biopolymer transporter ExbD [Pirellulaceae bacterium]|nr:biopolymer transporter ExbD [Pirellulaceae bacterium]
MRIRQRTAGASDKVEINMTPMIDVVFQLLAFFVMSFKVITPEGDFNIKMPLATRDCCTPIDHFPPLKIHLAAHADGSLASIELNDQSFGTNFDALRDYIIGIVGDERGPGSVQESLEVELACDSQLQYAQAMHAITAVSGHKHGDRLVKLVEQVKFSPPRG